MKEKGFIWYVICVVIGIIMLCVSVFEVRNYLFAEIKLSTTSTLVNVDELERFKKDDKGKQKPYYEYTLTWEYSIKDKDITNQYKTYTKSETKGLYHEGAQRSISVYSNDGKNYYIQEWMACFIVGGIGLLFLVFGIWDYISVTKHKKQQQNWQDVIKQRVQEAEEKKKEANKQ